MTLLGYAAGLGPAPSETPPRKSKSPGGRKSKAPTGASLPDVEALLREYAEGPAVPDQPAPSAAPKAKAPPSEVEAMLRDYALANDPAAAPVQQAPERIVRGPVPIGKKLKPHSESEINELNDLLKDFLSGEAQAKLHERKPVRRRSTPKR
jgi:hypothetical protein